jgi:hypothetical protein
MLSQRQEKYCNLIVFDELSAEEAKVKAGYSPRTCSTRISSKPQVKERIKELRQIAASDRVMPKTERDAILSDIIRSLPRDFYDISDDGRDVKIKNEALNSPAVTYIRTSQMEIAGKLGVVNVTRLGLADKLKAIELLNRSTGDEKSGDVKNNIYVARVVINENGHDSSKPFKEIISGNGSTE